MADPFWTVVTGALVFVIGQAGKAVLVDPIMEQRRVLGEIASNLLYYANIYGNLFTFEQTRKEGFPPETVKKIETASDTFRQLTARLSASKTAIAWYHYWEYTPWVPSREALDEAIGDLILLSNTTYKPEREPGTVVREERNVDTAKRIRATLGLNGRSRFWPHVKRMVDLRWRT